MATPKESRFTAFKSNVLSKIYDFDDAAKALSAAHVKVEGEEGRVQELRAQLAQTEHRLELRREEFDWVREEALKHCPALETGYGETPMTETVGIVDGRVTVVPIDSVKRDRPDLDTSEMVGPA